MTRSPRIRPRRGLLPAALLYAAASLMLPSAAAAGIWELYGGAGVNAGRVDNPRQSDPNAPASERRGAISTAVRLTGGVAANWARTNFDLSWSPQSYLYQNRSDLNAVSHNIASTWKHAWSPAASLELTETLLYSPENEVDPNALGQNAVLVERNRRTNSSFRGNYVWQAGRATTLAWRYTWLERAFSASNFIDTSDHNAAFEWRRHLSRGHSIFTSYQYGIFSFKGQAPGTDRHAANAGWGFQSQGGLSLNLAGGYNILLPDDPGAEDSSGLNLNAAVGYNTQRVSLTAGHTQGITDGGGVYANAESFNTHGDVRVTFSRYLSGDISYGSHVNERIRTTAGQAAANETIRSQSGRAQLTWRLGQRWSALASYTRHVQSVSNSASVTPATDLRSNRYAIGVSWSTR